MLVVACGHEGGVQDLFMASYWHEAEVSIAEITLSACLDLGCPSRGGNWQPSHAACLQI